MSAARGLTWAIVLGASWLAAACSSPQSEAGAGGTARANEALQAIAREAAKTCGEDKVLEVQPTYFRCK